MYRTVSGTHRDHTGIASGSYRYRIGLMSGSYRDRIGNIYGMYRVVHGSHWVASGYHQHRLEIWSMSYKGNSWPATNLHRSSPHRGRGKLTLDTYENVLQPIVCADGQSNHISKVPPSIEAKHNPAVAIPLCSNRPKHHNRPTGNTTAQPTRQAQDGDQAMSYYSSRYELSPPPPSSSARVSELSAKPARRA